MLVFAGVALLTIGSYFYDYHSNPSHPSVRSNFVSLQAFVLYLIYVAKYTGAVNLGSEWSSTVELLNP